jgi:hypothetical protein
MNDLPPGFELDSKPQGAAPGLPPGFELDRPGSSMSWGDAAAKAWGNIPASAGRFAKDFVQPFIHPIDTATGIKNVAEGALEKAGVMSGTDEIPYADAVGDYFKGRYGSVEGFKNSVAEDPIGIASDLATVLTAGGGLVAKAPGIAGKAGEVGRAVGEAANPANAVAGPLARGVSALRKGEVAAPTIDELKDAAQAGYEHPDVHELEFKPQAIADWKQDHLVGLDEDFGSELAPKTYGVLAKLDNPAAGATMTGRGVDALRRRLGKVAGGADRTDAEAARQTISALDDFVGNIGPQHIVKGDPEKVANALGEARGNYAAAKRSEALQEAADRALLQASSANSGANQGNALRQQIKSILTNPNRRRGFSKDELAQMTKFVRGNKLANITRAAGNMLGGGGGLGSTVSASAGAAAAGTAGAVAPVVGYALKKLSDRLGGADFTKLQEMVQSRSPLGEQVGSSLKKWAKAQRDANTRSTAKNVSALILASRNLSRNLADAGIEASMETIVGGGEASPETSRR